MANPDTKQIYEDAAASKGISAFALTVGSLTKS
jgi:hypothetical protein